MNFIYIYYIPEEDDISTHTASLHFPQNYGTLSKEPEPYYVKKFQIPEHRGIQT